MSDGTEREMTLAEWVGKLPTIHLAHREYTDLQAKCERLKAENMAHREWENDAIRDRDEARRVLHDMRKVLEQTRDDRAKAEAENAQLRADLAASKAKWVDVSHRLELWAVENDKERFSGRVPTFLNPHTVLTWMRSLDAERGETKT